MEEFENQAAALLNELQSPPSGDGTAQFAETSAPAESPFGDILPEKFFGALERLSGGFLKSEQDFGVLKAEVEQAKTMRQQFEQLRQQNAKFSNYNPLADKINEILSSGGKMEDVKRFVEVQSINLDALDEKGAYKLKMSLDHPHLTQSEIDALVDDEFGLGGDEQNMLGLTKLKLRGADAKKAIAEMKVAAENPQAVQQRALQIQRTESLQRAWSGIAESLAGSLANKVQANFGDGEDYSFEYKYSPEAIEYARQLAIEQAVHSNVPLDRNGAKDVLEFMQRMATAFDAQKMTTALMNDVWTKAKLAALKSAGGAQPPAAGQGARVQPSAAQQSSLPNIKSLTM